MRQKYQTLLQTHLQLEQQLKTTESKIEARDNEIIRLSQLYQGGQNLEKLNLKYHQETNEKVVTKLQNQVDFLNKENHRIQTQLDFFTRDKTVTDQIDQYRREIDDLAFENQTLRKDLRELTKTLKDYQEMEFKQKQLDKHRQDMAQAQTAEVERRLKECEIEKEKTQEERNRSEQMIAAYNADKSALSQRVQELERILKSKDNQYNELAKRLDRADLNDNA